MSGRAGASGRIAKPRVLNKYFIGGQIDEVWVGDVDGDGRSELVYLEGGSLVCRDAALKMKWESPPVGGEYFEGVYDLDGDGRNEVVVNGKQNITILSGRAKSVESI